ncbi:hypothetical protein ACOSQ4_014684 [Xanthoceras sorbifolium]
MHHFWTVTFNCILHPSTHKIYIHIFKRNYSKFGMLQNSPRKGRTINTNLTTKAFISLGERGERASWGRGAVQRRQKSGGHRGGAVGAAGGFTEMKCCSRTPKGKMQVGKKIKKNRLSTAGPFGPVVVCLSTTGHESP